MDNEPAARNAWAPELFYDAVKKRRLIFWATTIPGRFPETDDIGSIGNNHRTYYTTTHIVIMRRGSGCGASGRAPAAVAGPAHPKAEKIDDAKCSPGFSG